MKVQCGQCPAKYAVADERIRDKKVRIRCRRCNAAIVVDGKVSPPLVTSTPARRSARPHSSTPPEHTALREVPESLPPPSTPDGERGAPRPVAHTMMGGLEAPLARQLVTDHVIESQALAQARSGTLTGTGELRPGMPEPHRGFTEPPPRDEVERWRVALTQQDLRWMTTDEITEAFRDGAVKSETFVFKAGMPTWVTLLEVSEIARALAEAELAEAPLDALDQDGDEAHPPQRISSLPPPRKAARQRALAEEPTAEPASDSEESLPFNLVTGRANGSQNPEGTEDSPSADEAAAAPSAEAEPPAPAAAAPSEGWGFSDAAAPTTAAAVPPAPVAPPTPLEPAPSPAAAPAQRGGSGWIWLLVAVVLLAAAAFFVGPRFGLQLH